MIPRFYDSIFFGDHTTIDQHLREYHAYHVVKYSKIHESFVEPYAIYFPQFHAIPENDLNFYPGFTGMKNLINAKLDDPSLLTPARSILGYYDLEKDRDIIPRQVKMARAYGLAGFAVYYYWFSVNTITQKHPIFKAAIDQFFQEEYSDFTVFFVFCNEGWTSNPAFQNSHSSHEIYNKYDEDSFRENLSYLMPYFKHRNYRKIQNKPLLLIQHSDLMTESELRLFYDIGDEVTKANGFDGIVVALNNDNRDPDPLSRNFGHYAIHPQYKSDRYSEFIDTQRAIDYNYYARRYIESRRENNDTVDVMNSVFVNFDNTPRLYTHKNFKKIVTKTKNNGLHLFRVFLESQFMMYLRGKELKDNRIFLINSWNEWGEQMALEPSQEMGFAYLETFQKTLVDTFSDGGIHQTKQQQQQAVIKQRNSHLRKEFSNSTERKFLYQRNNEPRSSKSSKPQHRKRRKKVG